MPVDFVHLLAPPGVQAASTTATTTQTRHHSKMARGDSGVGLPSASSPALSYASSSSSSTLVSSARPAPSLPSPLSHAAHTSRMADDIARLQRTDEIIRYHNFSVESHFVRTPDSYILEIFRIPPSSSSSETKPNRRPLLFWHGLSTTSSLWVCNVPTSNNLALALAQQGYDIWLANSRGNEYSTHDHFPRSSPAFWDYSIDDLPRDVHAVVDHILATTQHDKLVYVGFSQGTAQMFAALATSPQLNEKIALFVALAPALKPHEDCVSPPLSHLVSLTPNMCYSLFGTRGFLDIARTVKHALGPQAFKYVISTALRVLFRWGGERFDDDAKIALYSHVFGHISVKTYTQWFQITQAKQFQRYNSHPGLNTLEVVKRGVWRQGVRVLGVGAGLFVKQEVAVVKEKEKEEEEEDDGLPLLTEEYPTWRITTPTFLVYGTADRMTDISHIRSRVGGIVGEVPVEGYTHMDFCWARCQVERYWGEVWRVVEGYAFVEEEEEDVSVQKER